MQHSLGSWSYKSKTQNAFHQGCMFPLLVTKQLDRWPEKDARQRLWMDIEDARDRCRDWWMKEALERLIERLADSSHEQSGLHPSCSAKPEQVECFHESDCISVLT